MECIVNEKGFTLIELMIVIAIIGILAVIAVPKFAHVVRKAREGNMKGLLTSIRSAVHIYYGDNEFYPVGLDGANNILSTAVVPKYIRRIRACHVPGHHSPTENETNEAADLVVPTDNGTWGYDGANASSFNAALSSSRDRWGDVWICCTHTDTTGKTWSAF